MSISYDCTGRGRCAELRRESSLFSSARLAIGALWVGGLPPQPLEPMASDTCVVRRMLRIAVPEVVLHGAQIGAPIGQVVAATVAQHVRPDPAKVGCLPATLAM